MARRLVMAALLPLAMTAALQARAGDAEDCYNDSTLRQTEPAKAAAACQRLAEQGDVRAQSIMGVLYAYGEGVPQDLGEAAKWYRKAADQGNAKAQYHLGLMYAKGRSVPQDLVQALMWLDLAAAQGDALAARSGDQVAAKMTPAQIREAEARIAAWKPATGQ
jgi:TPR repeat protein